MQKVYLFLCASGTAPHVIEPKYPGVVECYVNLGDCYDKAGLGDVRGEILSAMAGYKGCYSRAYHCLAAAAQIGADLRTLLLTPAAEEKMARRAKGILSRELHRGGAAPGHAVQRFLGAITYQGTLCRYDTADALCHRIYEFVDSYGLGHAMLNQLAAAAMAAGYDVIVCPAPMAPERMEHLLIPALSLAFVSSTSAVAYPGRPYRRIRVDAMADQELLRRNRARLHFSRKVYAALVGEATESLAQAKEMHDRLEALYNPYVDFTRVYQMADALAAELLS